MIQERISALREKMQAAGIHYYLIPSGDFHGSEYLSDHFRTMRFISGFTGSAGTVLVGLKEAWLWTDGRYFIQAERELAGSGICLMRMAQAGVPTVEAFLKEHLEKGEVLGFDGRCVSTKTAQALEKELKEKEISFFFERDLIGEIWEERPPQLFSRPFYLEEKYSGKSAKEKIDEVRRALKEKGATQLLIASLDDAAWLMNIRGDDIPCSPLVFSFVRILEQEALLYCRREVFSAELARKLAEEGVSLKEYEEIWEDMAKLPEGEALLFDPAKTALLLTGRLQPGVKKIPAPSPTTLMKAVKNPVEQEALRESHRKDGIAMVKWIYWLMHHENVETLSEIDAEQHLEKCRREQGAFELSFATIAAMGPNAAMMHYKAQPGKASLLKKEGLFLVDSGGQYLDGTTDITRTFAMGPLSDKEKLHYTAVLRSMLRLGSASFLKGVTCYFLDILARGPIWDMGIDYRCGTGHGVAFVSNVHEGPNNFRWSKPAEMAGLVELVPGMVTTDEPGVYIEGEYGIRIENELLCVAGEENEYGQFLHFEHLTLCPIDLRPVIKELLAPDEKKALNEYHAMVYERLKDGLTPEEAAWLKEVTAAI